MAESEDVEATKVKTCVAIAMHATTNEKFGGMSAGIIIASIVIAFIQKSFLPFVIGIVVSFLLSYLMRLLCYRRVERATGLPRFAQDQLLNLHKTNKQFAAAVERARSDAPRKTAKSPNLLAAKYTPEYIALIVELYPSVLDELMARDTVFRLDFDDKKRRSTMPFNAWGREFMQQEEYAIWEMLKDCNISESEAIEKITDIMEKYYGKRYPLR